MSPPPLLMARKWWVFSLSRGEGEGGGHARSLPWLSRVGVTYVSK